MWDFFVSFVSGTTSGFLVKTMTAPLSRMTILLQTQELRNDIPRHDKKRKNANWTPEGTITAGHADGGLKAPKWQPMSPEDAARLAARVEYMKKTPEEIKELEKVALERGEKSLLDGMEKEALTRLVGEEQMAKNAAIEAGEAVAKEGVETAAKEGVEAGIKTGVEGGVENASKNAAESAGESVLKTAENTLKGELGNAAKTAEQVLKGEAATAAKLAAEVAAGAAATAGKDAAKSGTQVVVNTAKDAALNSLREGSKKIVQRQAPPLGVPPANLFPTFCKQKIFPDPPIPVEKILYRPNPWRNIFGSALLDDTKMMGAWRRAMMMGKDIGPHFRLASRQSESWQYLKKTYQREGLLSFWRGNWTSIIHKSACTGINYFLFEIFKTRVFGNYWVGDKDPGFWVRTASGFCASTVSLTASYPFDITRTLLACEGSGNSFEGLQSKKTSFPEDPRAPCERNSGGGGNAGSGNSANAAKSAMSNAANQTRGYSTETFKTKNKQFVRLGGRNMGIRKFHGICNAAKIASAPNISVAVGLLGNKAIAFEGNTNLTEPTLRGQFQGVAGNAIDIVEGNVAKVKAVAKGEVGYMIPADSRKTWRVPLLENEEGVFFGKGKSRMQNMYETWEKPEEIKPGEVVPSKSGGTVDPRKLKL
jgi:hypothetical protein